MARALGSCHVASNRVGRGELEGERLFPFRVKEEADFEEVPIWSSVVASWLRAGGRGIPRHSPPFIGERSEEIGPRPLTLPSVAAAQRRKERGDWVVEPLFCRRTRCK